MDSLKNSSSENNNERCCKGKMPERRLDGDSSKVQDGNDGVKELDRIRRVAEDGGEL